MNYRNPTIWAILLSMIFIGFANFWTYDYPMLFEDILIKELGIDSLKIGMFYAVYSIPNIFLLPFGGLFINAMGVGFSSVILSSIIMASTVISSTGYYLKNYYIILFSKLVHGIGGESLQVAQNTIAEKWFTGSFLSLAIGMNTVVCFLASSSQDFLLPYIYLKFRDMNLVFFLMGVVAFLTTIVAVLFKIFDHVEFVKEKKIKREIQAELLIMNKDQILENSNDNEEPPVRFKLSHISHFGILYWMLILTFSIISMCYYQFMNFISDFLIHRFDYPFEKVSLIVPLIPIAAAIGIPIFSSLVVIYGKKGFVLIIASLCSLGSYLLFFNLPVGEGKLVLTAIGLQSLSYSLYSSVIWSSIALSVPREGTSVAFSIANSFQNLLMLTLPIMFGKINEERSVESYNNSIKVFLGMSCACLIITIVMTVYDLSKSSILNLSENNKKVLQSRTEQSDAFRASISSKESSKLATNL